MGDAAEDNSLSVSQLHILREYFEKHQNRDIPHPEVVDWATAEYLRRTGKVFRDPDRGIRLLHQSGFLQKIRKGVYRYDPDYVEHRQLEDFTPELKRAIFERDHYRCVICGRGPADGVDLHVDHIKPMCLTTRYGPLRSSG